VECCHLCLLIMNYQLERLEWMNEWMNECSGVPAQPISSRQIQTVTQNCLPWLLALALAGSVGELAIRSLRYHHLLLLLLWKSNDNTHSLCFKKKQ
jgi:hypothetical protein